MPKANGPPLPPIPWMLGGGGPFASSISDPICQVLYAIKICNCFGFECCLFSIRGGAKQAQLPEPTKGALKEV